MCVVLYQTKNGLFSLCARSMKALAAVPVSSSMVSIRFFVSGPVFSIFCPPLAVGPAVKHPARAEVLPEVREVLLCWIVPQFGLFLSVQVIEVAEELIETMHRRQVFVSVAQVVLAELGGGVAVRLEQLGDGGILRAHALGGARQAHLAQSRAEDALTHDESRSPRRATLLRVAVGKHHPFVGDAIDVGRLIAHHPPTVTAEVPVTDIVAPDDEDIGFLLFLFCHVLAPFCSVNIQTQLMSSSERRGGGRMLACLLDFACAILFSPFFFCHSFL